MLLLDTCALIWLFGGMHMSATARAAIEDAADADAVFVSAVSLWKIGSVARRPSPPITVEPDPTSWLESVLALPGVRPAFLSLQAALHAAFLPEPFHRDPADRLVVATARLLRAAVVTVDARILAYGRAGHVATLAY